MNTEFVRRGPINPIAACAFLLLTNGTAANELDDLQPGHWFEVPNSRLRDVVPDPAPPGNVENVIEAWSGGAFDTRRNRLLVWGGGHADYSGNEIYAFDLNSLAWERLTEPSPDVGGDPESGVYPDGQPRSRHTYDYIEYLPNQDLFCSFGGSALYPSGNVSTLRTDCYDFRNSQWVTRASLPSEDGSNLEAVTALDSETGAVYFKAKYTSHLAKYDPVLDRWQELNDDFYLNAKRTGAIDSANRVMVIVGEGDTFYYHLDSEQFETVSTSGSGPSSRAPGLVYDIASERIVAWEGGTKVYSLDVATSTWKTHNAASSNSVTPSDQSNWGTFGRFRYVPSKNLFVVVNGIDENVYAYKLSSGDGVIEDPVVPRPPSDLSAGSTGD